jgi:hypothetical protein
MSKEAKNFALLTQNISKVLAEPRQTTCRDGACRVSAGIRRLFTKFYKVQKNSILSFILGRHSGSPLE